MGREVASMVQVEGDIGKPMAEHNTVKQLPFN